MSELGALNLAYRMARSHVRLPERREGDVDSWCRVYGPDGWLIAVIDPADLTRTRKPILESHRLRGWRGTEAPDA
jgi:hypothetical protein